MDTITERNPHDRGYLWDLAKATLTSLSLLSIAGCAEQTASEKLISRPIATPVDILSDRHKWIEKQVTVHGNPVFVRDNSTLSTRTYEPVSLVLEVNLLYKIPLSDVSNGGDLYLYYRATKSGDIPLHNPTEGYGFPEGTNCFSGTLKTFNDSKDVFLEVDVYSKE